MQENHLSLARFLDASNPVTVLTGAGVSTASGIPEYRDRNGDWKHAKPVQFEDFMNRPDVRRRYWARSFAGWDRMHRADPNAAHDALALLQRAGRVDTLITQNVDGLHRRAGNDNVIDLHGRLDTVVCMQCARRSDRADWQARLVDANVRWHARVAEIRPDGDAELRGSDDDFSVPDCEVCGGIVKPDVVFFGESVPKQRVAEAQDAVLRSAALLIVGSSLMVFSGFRFARLAAESGKPIAIVNQGRTRADDLAALIIDGDCGAVLSRAVAELGLAAA